MTEGAYTRNTIKITGCNRVLKSLNIPINVTPLCAIFIQAHYHKVIKNRNAAEMLNDAGAECWQQWGWLVDSIYAGVGGRGGMGCSGRPDDEQFNENEMNVVGSRDSIND